METIDRLVVLLEGTQGKVFCGTHFAAIKYQFSVYLSLLCNADLLNTPYIIFPRSLRDCPIPVFVGKQTTTRLQHDNTTRIFLVLSSFLFELCPNSVPTARTSHLNNHFHSSP